MKETYGRRKRDVSPSSSEGDVSEVDQGANENMGGASEVADVSDDPEQGLGADAAALGATACLPPPASPQRRPRRERRRPGWLRDLSDVPGD